MWGQPPFDYAQGRLSAVPPGRSPADPRVMRLKTQPAYFKLNSAFTWAVTVTICGVNSSVGAGGAAAIAVIA